MTLRLPEIINLVSWISFTRKINISFTRSIHPKIITIDGVEYPSKNNKDRRDVVKLLSSLSGRCNQLLKYNSKNVTKIRDSTVLRNRDAMIVEEDTFFTLCTISLKRNSKTFALTFGKKPVAIHTIQVSLIPHSITDKNRMLG